MPCFSEGGFVIKNHIINKGNLRFVNSASTIGSDVDWRSSHLPNWRCWWPQCGGSFGKVVKKIRSRSVPFSSDRRMRVVINCLFRWALASPLIPARLRQPWISTRPLFEAALSEMISQNLLSVIYAIKWYFEFFYCPTLWNHVPNHRPIVVLHFRASRGPRFQFWSANKFPSLRKVLSSARS